ncbi:histidine kinase [Paenibacillus albidus]|uniref:histidine kinase n=1 Tax=Paenibacillus albidus TaxID=2041023 RepID=A0A917FFR6_9BACL|nr:sensor histidine kinase [Paenibacillus albidus]GGF73623.1 histidine kinase [Paenibacillus albidus]
MNKSNKHRKPWSLRSKTLLIFLLLIFIPLSLQGIATYVDFSRSTEQRTADYSAQLVEQMNANLDRTLMEMQRLTLMPLYDSNVLNILRKYSGSESSKKQPSVDERSNLQLYIASMTFDRPEIDSIQIFAGNGYTFSSKAPSAISAFSDVEEQSWYSRVKEADGAWVLIPPHHPSYYLEDARVYFSVSRLIREPNTNRTLGVVKIDLKQTLFGQIINNAKFEDQGSLVVQNSGHELFYEKSTANSSSEETRQLLDAAGSLRADAETAVHRLRINGKEYLIISDYSAYSDISIISYIPVVSLLKEIRELRNFTVGIGLISLALGSGLAAYFSYRLTRPLGLLMKKMRLVELGNFKQSVPVVSGDELGRLSSGFNRMVEEIDRLVHEVYMLGLKEKEAELAALQSQINPHFIYNTLESISMLARQRNNDDVSDMVTSLGRLIRNAVQQDGTLIPLGQELQAAESYVRIQEMRLGPRLRTVFDIEEGLELNPVPKLVLQPLIENAIVHGINDSEQGGTIWISAVRFYDHMLLTVRDDGRGMSEMDLDSLRHSLNGTVTRISIGGTEYQGHGVALRNIQQRLTLIFGSEYDLHVDGSPGQGMSFTLTIPLKDKEVLYDTYYDS